MAVKLDCFFEALAERLSKENHLSDVTYALCQSDKVFQQFFLDFFFGDNKIDIYKDKVEISRELSFENGRPDFTIHVGENDIYIVEVKIWDCNHHFSQYQSRLGNNAKGHLGYIANYEINLDELAEADRNAYRVACAEGETVKNWKEFVLKLERYQAFNDPVIKSYLNYVRSVCPFDEFLLDKSHEISLEDFKDSANFMQNLKETIDNTSNVSLYTRSNKYFVPQKWMGYYFELQEFDNEKSVWGWVGTLYSKQGGVICVRFENRDGWGKLVCEKFKIAKRDLVFYLTDKNKSGDFFKKVIDFIKNGNRNDLPNFISLNPQDAFVFKTLLATKSLPWLMDKYFLTLANAELAKNSNNACKWELSSTDAGHNDSEIPDSHCGRYYTLYLNNQRYIEFWLGVCYNNSLTSKSNERFSEQPKFIFDISNVDYDLISSDENAEWYVINEWPQRIVRNIALQNKKTPFNEVAASIIKLIKEEIVARYSVKTI